MSYEGINTFRENWCYNYGRMRTLNLAIASLLPFWEMAVLHACHLLIGLGPPLTRVVRVSLSELSELAGARTQTSHVIEAYKSFKIKASK